MHMQFDQALDLSHQCEPPNSCFIPFVELLTATTFMLHNHTNSIQVKLCFLLGILSPLCCFLEEGGTLDALGLQFEVDGIQLNVRQILACVCGTTTFTSHHVDYEGQ
ncbi:hypothetical protein GN956_G12072 [Arapaima gigas]